MAEIIAKLNAILADERDCVNTLRWAAFERRDANQGRLIDRILNSSVEICAELKNIIRSAGASPAATTAGEFSPPPGATLADMLQMVESTQRGIIARIDAILEETGLQGYGEPLLAIRQFHADNIRWLAKALGVGKEDGD